MVDLVLSVPKWVGCEANVSFIPRLVASLLLYLADFAKEGRGRHASYRLYRYMIATEEDRPTSEQRLNDARLMNASGWELEN